MLPLPIKIISWYVHTSAIFSYTFLINEYGSPLLKAIPKANKFFTTNNLHFLTMLTRFDVRLSVLFGDLSLSKSFTPTCTIAVS